jgi:hypothetical protein
MDDSTGFALLVASLILVLILILSAANPPPATTPIHTDLHVDPTALNWGNILAGGNYTQPLNITSATGTNPLNMTHNCGIGSVTWDAEGETVNGTLLTNIHLAVSPPAPTGQFNFTITISEKT